MIAVALEQCQETSRIINRYKDMVFGIALTHTSNKLDAEDVFQEVFLTYHRKQPACASEEHRKAWLIVTTINCARQITTSSWHKKVVPLHGQMTDEQKDEQFHFRTEEQDMVFSALQELPTKYKSVLYLFYFEDLSIAQISRILGLETGTVKVQLFRARALMRERLKGEYFDE